MGAMGANPFFHGGECPRRNQKRQEKGQSSSEAGPSASNQNDNAQQQQNQQAEGGANAQGFNGHDFLKKIGESVAMMLDPLGMLQKNISPKF